MADHDDGDTEENKEEHEALDALVELAYEAVDLVWVITAHGTAKFRGAHALLHPQWKLPRYGINAMVW